MRLTSAAFLTGVMCVTLPHVLAAQTKDYVALYGFDPKPSAEPAYIAPRDVETTGLVAALRGRMASTTNVNERLAILDSLSPTDWNILTVALFRVDDCQIGNLPNGMFEAHAELLDLAVDDVWPLRFRLNTGMTPAFKRFADAGQTVTDPTTFKLKDCE